MKSALIKFLLSGYLLFFICYCSIAQSAQHEYLLALSKAEHILAIIDPATLKIIARVPVGPDPHEIIATADGKYAYVSNMGAGNLHEMNVIDLVAQKALPNIDTNPFIGLHGLAFEGGKVWFTAEGSKAIGRIDVATNTIDWCIGTGENRTHMVFVTPDQKNIYTTNVNAGTVSNLTDTLIAPGGPPMGAPPQGPPGGTPQGQPPMGPPQPRRDWMHTVIPVAKGSEGFDVSPDGKQLWTVSGMDGSISIVDLKSKMMASKIDANILGANRLKFTPDGKRVLVSSLRTGDLFVYDVATHKEIKRVPIGHGGAGILVDADGSRAFIGCTPDNYVAVVDLKKLELVNKIELGGPDGLAWAVQQ